MRGVIIRDKGEVGNMALWKASNQKILYACFLIPVLGHHVTNSVLAKRCMTVSSSMTGTRKVEKVKDIAVH